MRLFNYMFGMFFVSSLLMFSALAEASVAEFKKVHGVVDVFPAGERKAVPVKVGSSVNVGDTVRTGRRSRAQLKFSDGSVLNIGSLSKIEIGEFSFNAEKKVRKSNIRNLRGKVRAAVSKSANKQSYFRIQTPGAVAAVRGTVLQVGYVNGVTDLSTTEGSVAFTITQGPMAGQTVIVNANQVAQIVMGQTTLTVVFNVTEAQMARIIEGTEVPAESGDPGGDSGATDSGASGTGTGGTGTGGTGTGGTGTGGTGTGGTGTGGTGTGGTGVGGTGAGGTGAGGTGVAAPVVAPAPAPAPVVVATTPVVVAPAVVPVVVTPPVTTTVPAVQNTNVNVVIQF